MAEKTLLEKHLITRLPIVEDHLFVRDVLSHLEEESEKYDSVDYIYVFNTNRDFTGMFSIQELFNNPKETPIKEFLVHKPFTISPRMDLEQMAHVALKHKLKQVPVVKSGRLLGAVPAREIFSTLNKSLKEDILHFAGVHKSHMEFDNTLEMPIYKAVKTRVPWLIIGLLGAIFMAAFIHFFEDTLGSYIIIAAFIPAIVYISDALASQTLTIFIRDLAVSGKAFDFKKYFFRQLFTAFLISFVISVVMLVAISLLWGEAYIALVISLAAFASLLFTTLVAIFIAVMIKRFKYDPALGSGPVATIIADVSSVMIYFAIVMLML